MKRALVFAFLLALGCQKTQTPYVSQSAQPTLHAFSGLRFPETVGAFRQGEVKRYDRDGRDMSVSYKLARLGAAVAGTVYIYPAPIDVKIFPFPKVGEASEWFVKSHAEEIKKAIIRNHTGAQVLSEDDVEVNQLSGLKKGRKVLFQYIEDTPYGSQTFLSEMLLFTHGKWFIKYRFTYLRDYKSVVRKDIDEFVKAMKWPQ